MISASKDLSTTTPLSTIPPERINTTGVSSAYKSSDENRPAGFEQQARLEETRILQQLRARDREVRAHEAAHIAAGREYIRGGPNFTLQQGPDGRSYAIGGEVQLDASPVSGDPEATLSKAEIVRRAALAPAQPSPQDVQVASDASAMAARARVELAIQRRNDAQQPDDGQQNNMSLKNAASISAFQMKDELPSFFSQYA
ncbi:MAG: putative metalloprotease CJM1_0395 family protein [Gammaproteobacteria bacterium]|nr:putative metalloprotease CJM1_0395 family protein [Gammaproteobacteria bacterium]